MEFTQEAREVLLRVTLEEADTEDEPGTWVAVAAVRVDPGDESEPALTLSGVSRDESIEGPVGMALNSILAGVRRVWPDQTYPLPLRVEVDAPYGSRELAGLISKVLAVELDKREWDVQTERQGN